MRLPSLERIICVIGRGQFGVGTHKLFKFIETGDLSKFLRVTHLYRGAILGRLGNLKSGAAPHPFRVGAPILSSPRRPGTWEGSVICCFCSGGGLGGGGKNK